MKNISYSRWNNRYSSQIDLKKTKSIKFLNLQIKKKLIIIDFVYEKKGKYYG